MMKKIILLSLFFSIIHADIEPNNNCNQVETIQPLNNAVANITYTENGKVSKNDKYDYYTFQLNSKGILHITANANKNFTMKVGSSCGSSDIYQGQNYKKTHQFTYIIKNSSQPVYIQLYRKYKKDANYQLTITFTAVQDIQNTTDDICHTEIQTSGLMCIGAGPCAGGIGCKKTIGIRNLSNEELKSVTIFYDETNLGFTFGNHCGVEPSGTCSTESNIQFPLIGFLGKSTKFTFSNPIPTNNSNENIWVANFMSGSCFGYEKFYGYYILGNVLHYGKIKNCSTSSQQPDFLYKEKEFELVNSQNSRLLKGNIVTVGNTILCPKDSTGQCIDNSTLSNADLNLRYIDIDNDNTTYNSSKAKITLPQDSTVIWAGLFIQGYLHYKYYNDDHYSIGYNFWTGNVKTEDIEQALLEPIKIKTPFNTTYLDLLPNEFYLLPNRDYKWNDIAGYTYEAFIDLTSIFEGKTAQEVNGWYYVGNIKAQEYDTRVRFDGLGNYGAWTIVLIYKNNNEKLRNLSVFNGYKEISANKPNVNIQIEGFYTPTSGNVDAKLSVFVGEGDKNIAGDKLILEGTVLPNNTGSTNNFFNSFISNIIMRTPAITNNNGIDIQELNVGKDGDTNHPQIIGNNQTSTEFTFTSTQDKYFPSMLSFAVEMYQPQICYLEELYTKSGQKVTTSTNVNIGDVITAKLTIKNLGNEVAKNVEIFKKFDSTIEYVPNSTLVQDTDWTNFYNIDDNDDYNSVHVDFQNDTLHIYYLGNGGTSTQFTNNDVAYIDYNFTIEDEQNISLTYRTSYNFVIAGIEFNLTNTTLPQCIEFNNTIVVTNLATGPFDAWDNFRSINDRNISTKIVNESFTLTLASLNASNNALETKSNITTKYRIYGIDSQMPLTNFSDFDASSKTDEPVTFTIDKSEKNATVQFLFCAEKSGDTIIFKSLNECGSTLPSETELKNNPCDYKLDIDSVTWKTFCSSDQFAIRPKTFSITTPSNPITAGESFQITFQALENGNVPTQNFNSSVLDFNLTFKETKPECLTGSFSPTIDNWSFTNGQHVLTTAYTEVGVVELNLSEKNDCNQKFAAVDCDDADTGSWTKANDLAIQPANVSLIFIPHHFKVDATFKNYNNLYTYISEDLNMSSRLELNITAKNANDITTQNYNKLCYSKDQTILVTHSLPPQKTSKIIFIYKDAYGVDSAKFQLAKENNITFPYSKNNFLIGDNNGSTRLTLFINFDRNASVPIDPFTFQIKDINTTDSDNIDGQITLNTSSNYYYARLNIPTQTITGTLGDIKAYYEIYSKNGNDPANIKGIESPTDVNWYINISHTSKEGNISTPINSNLDPYIQLVQKKSITNGEQNLTLKYSGSGFPYAKTFTLNTQPWLLYNQFDSTITTVKGRAIFNQEGNWLGKGSRDTSNDSELAPPKNENSRILW